MAAANKRKFNPPQAETSNGRSKYHSLYINSDSLHNKRSPPPQKKKKKKKKKKNEHRTGAAQQGERSSSLPGENILEL